MLSTCGDLTRIAVTCACILTSKRSTMGRPFSFIAIGMLSYRSHLPKKLRALSFGTTF